MGLFNRVKKVEQAEPTVSRTSILTMDGKVDKHNWFEVFSACLGENMAIQQAASEMVVKGRHWNADLSKGTISFGTDSYPIQFLGSESSSSNSWLWGWKNINHLSPAIIQMAEQTKAIGEQWQLEPLTIAEFTIDDTFNGYSMAMVACSLSKQDVCYYRGPHDKGAIFMSLSNLPKEVFLPVSLPTFSSITMSCIQQYHIDHILFIEGFLMWNQTPYEWKDNTIIAHFDQDYHITFETVDGIVRIASMKAM